MRPEIKRIDEKLTHRASTKTGHQDLDPDDPFAFARRMSTPVWIYDTDFKKIAYANQSACTLWAADNEEELAGRNLSEGMSKAVETRLAQYQRDFLRSDSRFSETWTLYPNGQPRTVDISYSGFVMPDGRMAMICEVIGTWRKDAETIRRSDALLHTSVSIVLFSGTGKVLYQNPAARALSEGEHFELQNFFEKPDDFATMVQTLETTGEAQHIARIETSKGEIWLDVNAKRCLDAATGNAATLVSGVDITELKRTRDAARYLASRDQLTGCFNRNHLQNIVSAREGSIKAKNRAILLLDIDKFKSVNDRYGHTVGDKVLATIGRRLRHALTKNDIVVRSGGDEFIVFMKSVGDEKALAKRVSDLCQDLSRSIDIGSFELNISVSVGSTIIPAHEAANWSRLYREADLALHSSKNEGGQTHSHFNQEIAEAELETKWLEAELTKAVKTKSFELHYQPRVDIKKNKVVGVEALLRWHHPDRGYIEPGKFIPICERIGLIDELGLFVFNEACNQLIIWRKQGRSLNVSINVSPQQFLCEDFIANCERAASTVGFDPQKIEIEITESTLVGDDCLTAQRIGNLKKLGFRIALDDFGTGYSNLAHISRFPVDCIKIDKSFTSQLPNSGPLISLVFALSNQIEACVVAEGVERLDQFDWLQNRGCDQIQGFVFSPAVPADKLIGVCEKIEAKLGKPISRGIQTQRFARSI